MNNPDLRSPYTDETLSTEREVGWRERLAGVPVLGRFIKPDPAKMPKMPEPPAWSAKPRIPGIFHHKIKYYLSSPNITVDRFRLPTGSPAGATGGSLRTRWSEYVASAKRASQSAVAQTAIKKANPGYTPEKMALVAAENYVEINRAFFKGRVSVLRQLTTEKVYSRMKRDVKLRITARGSPSFDWQLHEFVCPPEIVQVRAFPIRNEEDVWAQVTVKFESIQSLKIGGGAAVSAERLPVVEYWVFERPVKAKDAFWRLCDRLTAKQMATSSQSTPTTPTK